jgi:hypothetical protein
MTRFTTLTIVAITIAPGIAEATTRAAPEPTIADIAGCNEQAAARTSASALPHPGSKSPDAGDADRGVAEAPKPPAGTPMPGTGGPGEKTDPSGSIITGTPDPLVKGMDAAKADDPQYRAAYRDCIRAKLDGR